MQRVGDRAEVFACYGRSEEGPLGSARRARSALKSEGVTQSEATNGWTVRGWVIAGCFALAACSSAASKENAAPLRSPSRDYPLPAVTTSNGEVVGADRQHPSEKLETSPALGSGGPTPAAGAVVPESAEHEHPSPCDEIGLQDSSGKSPCSKTRVPVPTAPRGK